MDQAEHGSPLTKSNLLFSVKFLVEQCYDKEKLLFTNGIQGLSHLSLFKKEQASEPRRAVEEGISLGAFDVYITMSGTFAETTKTYDPCSSPKAPPTTPPPTTQGTISTYTKKLVLSDSTVVYVKDHDTRTR